MPHPVRILKVDPSRRLIVQMPLVPSARAVKSLIGVSKVGWRVLLEDINGEKLIVASKADRFLGKPTKEWRIRGGENTAGIGFLFGTLNRAVDAMWHCPVSKEWLERNIVWCEPGEDAPAEEVKNPNLDQDPEGGIQKLRDKGLPLAATPTPVETDNDN